MAHQQRPFQTERLDHESVPPLRITGQAQDYRVVQHGEDWAVCNMLHGFKR